MGAIGGVAWLLTAGAAAAQEAPNLTGTWVPHGGAHILEGETLHRQSGTAPVEGAEGLARHTSPFVFRIENQDGRTFWGEFSSASITERLIGALSPDGERFVMADEDGWFSGTVVDVDTLDFCYVHVAPENRAVACGYLRRQD
jgi:hypothetical protein